MALYNLSLAVQELHISGQKLFNLQSLSRLLEINNPRSARSVVMRLTNQNILTRIAKDTYMLTQPAPSRFAIANFLYSPSYISLETALNYHGILSQFPLEITSVTPKKSITKRVDSQVFSYAHLKSDLFWGYEKIDNELIALPEKALLDQMYLTSKGLRIVHFDEYDLTRLNKSQFLKFAKLFPKMDIPTI